MSEKVKCQYCGREFSKKGIKLHELTCKNKTPEERAAAPKPRKPKEERREYNYRKCPDCGSTDDFRFLSDRDPTEKYMKDRGYKYICNGCKEVI